MDGSGCISAPRERSRPAFHERTPPTSQSFPRRTSSTSTAPTRTNFFQYPAALATIAHPLVVLLLSPFLRLRRIRNPPANSRTLVQPAPRHPPSAPSPPLAHPALQPRRRPSRDCLPRFVRPANARRTSTSREAEKAVCSQASAARSGESGLRVGRGVHPRQAVAGGLELGCSGRVEIHSRPLRRARRARRHRSSCATASLAVIGEREQAGEPAVELWRGGGQRERKWDAESAREGDVCLRNGQCGGDES